VATSGDYQRYFIKDKVRFHHILNPKDGWPENQTMSATVIADTVMDADALSTALFILGPSKGIGLINSLEGVEGMILSKLGFASYSSGFRNLPGLSLQGLEKDLFQQVATN
jgi:thiamine biosynthesis lipoprotein